MWGLFKPRHNILGADVAGTVEAVGESVTRYEPGDAVFGDLNQSGWGGYAEYVCAGQNLGLIRITSHSSPLTLWLSGVFPFPHS